MKRLNHNTRVLVTDGGARRGRRHRSGGPRGAQPRGSMRSTSAAGSGRPKW